MAYVVSIAGSDSSGGAGNQADVAGIQALGHHALSVVTAITAQDTKGVHHIAHAEETSVRAQLKAVFSSFKIGAVKSGMLPNTACVQSLATTLQGYAERVPYVLDPVMLASSGESLVQEPIVQQIVDLLFPLATVVTPNVSELEHLSGRSINTLDELITAGIEILELGCRAVLITRGEAADGPCVDYFLDSNDDRSPYEIAGKYVENRSPRGTGCAYAVAIACALASDFDLYPAILRAKQYINLAIANAYPLNSEYWFLNHQAAARQL